MDLSVLIANRNGRALLRDCIESINRGTREISFEIVVIDNASSDGSREMLEWDFPAVQVVRSETALGYGASHNLGFRHSRGEYVLILNNDMIVGDGALDKMMRRARAGDRVGMVGCRLRNSDGSLQPSCGRDGTVLRTIADDVFPFRTPFERLGIREWMREWSHDRERFVEVIQGSCMLLPRSVFEAVGGFDESFHFFREEFDLCRRVRDAGYQVLFYPDAEIVHLGGQSMKSIPVDAMEYFFDSRYKYFKKHSGPIAACAVVASGFIGVVARLIAWEVRSRLRPGDVDHALRARGKYRHISAWFFGRPRPWFSSGNVGDSELC